MVFKDVDREWICLEYVQDTYQSLDREHELVLQGFLEDKLMTEDECPIVPIPSISNVEMNSMGRRR